MGKFASLDWRRWGTILGTLVLAFMCGHVMQSFLADPGSTENSKPVPTETLPRAIAKVPSLPEGARIPPLRRPPVMPKRVAEAHVPRTSGCDPVLEVSGAPAATIRVALRAKCNPNTPVLLQMGELSAQISTDEFGRWSARLPALDTNPLVELDFADHSLSMRVQVQNAEIFQHVVLLWEGEQSLKVRASEFGAFGTQEGHIWAGAPASPERAAKGEGGFLTAIGDGSGPAFEVYSFPATGVASAGVVRLTVEAPITEENCETLITGTAFQTSFMGKLRPTQISMTMPSCSRVGEVLRLQNLFRDMRLAVR